MSWQPCPDPTPGDSYSCDFIDTYLVPRTRDLGDFKVGRVLPSPGQAMIGPFIFLDQMGPTEFAPNGGIDINPHPHINLATVTYLFEGEMIHRDSLGTEQIIHPGDVNWMSAGSGITHSEHSSPAFRASRGCLSGLQTWVALPSQHEEDTPFFTHTGKDELPLIEDGDSQVRLVIGSGWGSRSPVETLTDTVYADITLSAGTQLPIDAHHEDRAIYTVSGQINIGNQQFDAGQLLILKPDMPVTVRNTGRTSARMVFIGGETMDGPRYIWWNFVSSRRERIEQAKAEWKTGHFDTVPGDPRPSIPLPKTGTGKPRRINASRA